MADNEDYIQGAVTVPPVSYPIRAEEGIREIADPLSLDIEDDELVKIIDKRIDDSKNFYRSKYDLFNRRKKMEMYLFGRQIADKEKRNELKPYESRNLDNVLYEIEASIKPLAMSKLPDMMVMPGSNDEQKEQTAEDLTRVINDDLHKRQNRKVLALAFKHLPVYFTGVIKARWDPTNGKSGDYVFDIVHPDNIIVDHLCTSSNADEMSFVAQSVDMTVQELVMRFPNKKDKLFEILRKNGLVVGMEPSWKDLATTVKIWEVWSSWYIKSESPQTPDTQPQSQEPITKWERVDGVVWKYETLILKKLKNPYYDHQGEEKVFTYDDPANELSKRELTKDDAIQAMLTGVMPTMTKEMIYHNYFQQPRKPFYFMTYDQWGKQPLDETSRIEQNIKNQENLDTRQKQINETLNNRGKHIFSKDTGLKADDIERMDLDDPKQDLLVEGNVNNVHSYIQPERPTAQEFNDIQTTRQRMYSLSGSNAIRGELQSQVATSNQIAREADFTRADDLVEDTINAACEWMAAWSLQFVKLRYTESHLRRLLGSKGQITFMKLHRDMIDDGMEVVIKASSTDKIRAQKNALDFAKLGPPFIDPVTFFKDMDIRDPENRAEMGLTFASNPAEYQLKYIEGMKDTASQVDGLLGQGAATALGGPQASMAPQQNAPPVEQPPMAPTPQDTAQVPTTQPPVPQGSPRLM